jgi:hypothetical protein
VHEDVGYCLYTGSILLVAIKDENEESLQLENTRKQAPVRDNFKKFEYTFIYKVVVV